MDATVLYQPVSDSRQYYYHYRDLKEDMGPEYATLLAFRTDPYGTPLVNEEPLAVGGFFRKEATADEKKALLSRAMDAELPKPVEHNDTYWEAMWEELTPGREFIIP